MARTYRPVDRDQLFLMPASLKDWLPPGHLAWFVIDVVGTLDLSAFHAARRLGGVGRAGHDPQMLLALLVYAYCTGVRSSRRIEALCQVDVAYRVICAQDAPDHTTIARFRAEHEQALKTLFDQVLALCAQAGLGKLGTVAVDGSKIAANASPEANRTASSLRAEVDRMFGEAAATDAAEDALFGPDRRGDELPDELANPGTRQARLRRALDELDRQREQAQAAAAAQAAKEAARPPTRAEREAADRAARAEDRLRREREAAAARRADMDARREAAHAAGQAYSGPRRPKDVDEYATVRAAAGRAEAARADAERARERREQAAAERQQRREQDLAARAEKAKANTTDPDSRLLPVRGGGWIQGYNAQAAVSADQIVLATSITNTPADAPSFTPMMRAAERAAQLISTATGTPHTIGTLLGDAGYDSVHNLTVDGPHRLIAQHKTRDQRAAARDNPAQGPPPGNATPRERMDHLLRTPDGQQTYAHRATTVEPVFGHIKEHRGFRRLTRRGHAAVDSEWNFLGTVHNLLKLHQARLAT